MYSLAIYLYMFCVNVASLFKRKARLMMQGHRQTYRILREQIDPGAKYIWFHAASLGEFEQGRPLMEQIRREYPQYKLLLTFFSPSGYEVRKDYKGADVICYLPFDTALNARKFLRLVHPSMAFFIKYEFWQNYLAALHRRHVPVFSVSSIFRPNQIFFRKFAKPYSRVLRCFTHFFVQNENSRKLLVQHGISNVTVVGDTRFDRVIQIRDVSRPLPVVESFVRSVSPVAQILVAGSSWQPDEDIIIDYFNRHPGQKLILAPHVVSEAHLLDIESKLQRSFLRYSRATTGNVAEADCLIIDCYGLLSSIYRYGQIAYVGGGFGVGIHNVPEAAVYGIPVIIGPNNANFREAQNLLRLGGCFEIKDKDSYEQLLQRFTSDTGFLQEAGKRARDYIVGNAGATEEIFHMIDFDNLPSYEALLDEPSFTGLR